MINRKKGKLNHKCGYIFLLICITLVTTGFVDKQLTKKELKIMSVTLDKDVDSMIYDNAINMLNSMANTGFYDFKESDIEGNIISLGDYYTVFCCDYKGQIDEYRIIIPVYKGEEIISSFIVFENEIESEEGGLSEKNEFNKERIAERDDDNDEKYSLQASNYLVREMNNLSKIQIQNNESYLVFYNSCLYLYSDESICPVIPSSDKRNDGNDLSLYKDSIGEEIDSLLSNKKMHIYETDKSYTANCMEVENSNNSTNNPSLPQTKVIIQPNQREYLQIQASDGLCWAASVATVLHCFKHNMEVNDIIVRDTVNEWRNNNPQKDLENYRDKFGTSGDVETTFIAFNEIYDVLGYRINACSNIKYNINSVKTSIIYIHPAIIVAKPDKNDQNIVQHMVTIVGYDFTGNGYLYIWDSKKGNYYAISYNTSKFISPGYGLEMKVTDLITYNYYK